MEIILDVQGFVDSHNKFVPKEIGWLSVYNLRNNLICIRVKPPCTWEALPSQCKATNAWLTRNYHGLDWNRGDVHLRDLSELMNRLLDRASRIYVKGKEKKEWLDGILDDDDDDDEPKPVVDLETLNCPNIQTLQQDTEMIPGHEYEHGNAPNCALQNVLRLKEWYLKNCPPSFDKSLYLFLTLRSLKPMKTEDIELLDKHTILESAAHEIDAVWNKLPAELQTDEEIAGHRRCQQHYCSMNDDQFDGPIPMIKDCKECQRTK